MTDCNHEIVELYFYGELNADERDRAHAHILVCAGCAQSLADLRAIEEALAARAVDAPPAGDWSGFMTRLNSELDRGEAVGQLERNLPTQPSKRPTFQPLLRFAASLALIASGALGGWTLSRMNPDVPQVSTLRPSGGSVNVVGESGLDRARVVLAGLANKDQGAEWSIEQRMAATLLPEVTLIRQAAASRGRADLEDILTDVETLLLQASYAPPSDADALEQLRGMIDRRDLLVRLSMATRTANSSQAGTD